MAADFATLADLKKHWADLPADREDEATQKLHEASVEVRGIYPDTDRRIATEELDPDVPRLVVCRMVKRAMNPDTDGFEGVSQVSQTAGIFSQAQTFSNPNGDLFLSAADKRLLGSRLNRGKAWTIRVGGPQ